MSVKIMVDTKWDIVECSECGIEFCISDAWEQHRRDDHKTFYCPNGHSQYFPHQSEKEKLQEELRKEHIARIEIEAKLNGALDTINKTKKRINAGVCPDCHRHFTNLERHRRTKHSLR